MLDSKIQHLDLVNLLSERLFQVRNATEKLWSDQSDLYISNSEWFIMSKIYKEPQTIAYVSKHVNFSRQATHKFVKRLEANGLIEIRNVENNKKEKSLHLTKLGEECFEKNEALKTTIEKELAERIGIENISVLKEILKLDWRL
ncbi:MarR family winged helix-turn-helix transcriptional regulator [Rummeliibacillus sp. JY-2-4R]